MTTTAASRAAAGPDAPRRGTGAALVLIGLVVAAVGSVGARWCRK